MENEPKPKLGRPPLPYRTVPYRRLVREEHVSQLDQFLDGLRKRISKETAVPKAALSGESREPFTREKQIRKKGAK